VDEHDGGGLGPGVAAWIEAELGGRVSRVERRIHPRPMWEVDVVRSDGAVVPVFVRGERGSGSALASVYDLAREAAVVRRLSAAGVATPAFLGHRDDLGAMLLERVGGRSDAHVLGGERRTRVARHFMEVLADLHALDAEALAIPGLAVPRTSEQLALGELLVAEELYARADVPPEPFITFGGRWLRAHVPSGVVRPVVVQGDTGPGNFMYDGDRVTHLFDWEMAHLGDPMEDLAAVCVRDMVTPFADLPDAFAAYGARAGAPVDLDRVRYHRVSKCVRSLMAITSYAHQARRPDEVALWHGWRALYLRSGCQALVEAEGGTWAEPGAADGPTGEPDPWFAVVAGHLDGAVRPHLPTAFDRHQLDGALAVLAVLADDSARGGRGDDDERADLAALLGGPVPSVDAGLAALDARLAAGRDVDDAAVLAYLCRRSHRTARRARPIMGAFADHRFNPIAGSDRAEEVVA
jgi:aminoglycoside phosphotransferase (APT) family kinase protein